MRPSASATKRIAAPSHRTQHSHHTSLRSPYPSAPIQATPNANPRWQGKHAVADHVISQLKEHGDPWKLSEEARPKGGPTLKRRPHRRGK